MHTHARLSAILGRQQAKINGTSVARPHFGIYFIVSLLIVQPQYLGDADETFQEFKEGWG